MSKIAYILIALIGVLVGIIGFQSKKTSKQKSKTQDQDKTIKKAEENIKEVQDAQEKIKQLDAEYQKPQTVQSAATGDSTSRIDRLNKLFNTTRKNS